jgi:hypothetical protein
VPSAATSPQLVAGDEVAMPLHQRRENLGGLLGEADSAIRLSQLAGERSNSNWPNVTRLEVTTSSTSAPYCDHLAAWPAYPFALDLVDVAQGQLPATAMCLRLSP